MPKPAEEAMIAGYFPVFHDGYLRLLNSQPDATVGVLGNDVLETRFGYLRKDIRALTPEQAVTIIGGLGRVACVIKEAGLPATMSKQELTMPDDDVSHALATEFDASPHFIPVFLRWDRDNATVNADVLPDRVVTLDADDPIIKALYGAAEKSPNWWRHIGAALVNDEGIASLAYNTSLPTRYSSAIDGDPRITARRGEAIERSVDIHAEAKTIANCAANGIATKGTSLYVTTFPCANCAKLIAESGISNCYFVEGYATIDGQDVLKAYGVEIVKIDTDVPPADPKSLREYPAS